MPHLPAAAVLILLSQPHPDKQRALAFAAAAAEQYRVSTVCHRWRDAVALLVSCQIVAVICALDPGDEVRHAIEGAGGQLVLAREPPGGRIRRDLQKVMERMYLRGIDTQEISKIVQVSSGDVRRSLWRIRRRNSRE